MDAVRDGRAELRGDAARHLTRVLRAKAGQLHEISDGGTVYLAEIVEAHPDCAVFRVVEPLAMPPEPLLRVTLCAALIKFDRFEWIVEKATELGVERIVPVETALSEKGLREASAKRAPPLGADRAREQRAIAAPARSPGPAGGPPRRGAGHGGAVSLLPRRSRRASLHGILPEDRTRPGEAALLIGPEGGWTDGERRAAANAGWLAAGLGPRILRAETAALAALAVLITAWTA